MAIAQQTIDQISQRIDIVSLVGEYVQLKPRGHSWWGCCPFHQERSPSFSVDPDKKLYYCFGCQAGGTAFKFLMEMQKVDFTEAVEQLAQRTGVELRQRTGEELAILSKKKSLEELYRRVTTSFQHCLWEHEVGTEARTYLHQRGISREVAQHYLLGYAPPDPYWLHRLLTRKGYSAPFLAESGFFSRNHPEYSLFSHRLLFPVSRKDGQVIAFSGRQLGSRGPKYINTPDTVIYHKKESLFGLGQAWPALTQQRKVYLCEGNFDVLSLAAAGVTAAVAPLGTALTIEQLRLLQRRIDQAILVFDGDQAGERAMFKGVALLEKADICPFVALLPPGSDPSQLFTEQGAEFLRDKTEHAVDFCQFLGQFIGEHYDGRRINDVQSAAQWISPIVQASPSALRAELYLQKVAGVLGVSEQALAQEIKRGESVKLTPHHLNSQETRGKNGLGRSEVELMLRIAAHPDAFGQWRERIDNMGLGDTSALFLYNALLSEEKSSWASLLRKVEEFDPDLASRLATLHFSPPKEGLETLYLSCKRMALLRDRSFINERLAQLDQDGSATDWSETKALLAEQMEINQKLVQALAVEQQHLLARMATSEGSAT